MTSPIWWPLSRLLTSTWRLRRPAVGVDLARSAVRVVGIAQGDSSATVVSAISPLASAVDRDGVVDDVEGVGHAIRALLEEARLPAHSASISLPTPACRLRHVAIAHANRRARERRVHEEIEAMDLPNDREWSVDWSSLASRRRDGSQELLLAAAPTEVVRSYVSCLRAADLMPLAVEVEVVALGRLATLARTQLGRTIGVVHVAADHCALSVLQDDTPGFHGWVPRNPAEDPSTEAVGLADSIHHALGFFWSGEREAPIDEILLTGSGAAEPGLRAAVEARLRADTRMAEPLQLVAAGGSVSTPPDAKDGPEWALAVAAALRGFERS